MVINNQRPRLSTAAEVRKLQMVAGACLDQRGHSVVIVVVSSHIAEADLIECSVTIVASLSVRLYAKNCVLQRDNAWIVGCTLRMRPL